MSKELIDALVKYKRKQGISWNELADLMGTTRLNLYRWRQAKNVKGMGEKVVSDFINKEKSAGKF